MEIERKYYVPEDQIEEIWQDLLPLCQEASVRERKFAARYWDSQDGDLQKMEVVYRTRREGQDFVATIKSSGRMEDGSFLRAEENQTINQEDMDRPSLDPFRASRLGRSMIQAMAGKPFVEVMRIEVQRRSANLKYGQSPIELCIDLGQILAKGKSLPVCELELELISGSKEDLVQLGRDFEKRYGLEAATQSKFERGLKIAN